MRFNKRGDSDSGSGSIIILIVLVLVAGLIIWFLYNFWGTAGSTIDAQDPVTISAIYSCKASIEVSDKNGYCNQFKQVKMSGGKTQYVTCEYIQNKLRVATLNATIDGNCEDDLNVSQSFCCNQLAKIEHSDATAKWTEFVNGERCEYDNSDINVIIKAKYDGESCDVLFPAA